MKQGYYMSKRKVHLIKLKREKENDRHREKGINLSKNNLHIDNMMYHTYQIEQDKHDTVVIFIQNEILVISKASFDRNLKEMKKRKNK